VAFVFTATSVTWNTPATAAPAEVVAAPAFSIDSLAIPAEMGTITKEYGVRSTANEPYVTPYAVPRTVILIQDAHAVIDAQENIRKILGHLQKNYGVNLAALEGAKGRLEPILLRTFPEPDVKRKILAGYEKRAELSGPEVAAVMQEESGEFRGMEDWGLYEKNYFAYLRAQEKKPALLKQWNAFKQTLDSERAKVYDPKLNEFEEARENFLTERASLLDLLVYLSNFQSLLKAASGYQELPGLISSIGYEKTGKQEALAPLVRKIADEFKTKYLRGLGVKTEMNFYNRYQAFMTGQITAGQMLQYLVQVGRENGKTVKLTPALKKLLGHAELLSEIKGSRLYDELLRFLPEVESSLIKTPAQRELAAKYLWLYLLKDLINLELTHEQLSEWMKFENRMSKHETNSNDKNFKNTNKKVSNLEDSGLEIVSSFARLPFAKQGFRDSKLNEMLQPALEFYQAALERDQAFMGKIDAMMKDAKQTTVAVVAGGFHTSGLERILKGKGVAYAVVTPKIASLAGSENYARVMKGEVSFKDYLKTTYFDALMRHAVKALVEALPLPDRLRTVKVWRDNVIRELAKEGRITDAGKFLPYIDEMLQRMPEAATAIGPKRTKQEILDIVRNELEKFKKDSLEKIWKTFEFQLGIFTDGLKQLIAKKELSTQSVSALLDRASQSKPSFVSFVQILDRSNGFSGPTVARAETPEKPGSDEGEPGFETGAVPVSADEEILLDIDLSDAVKRHLFGWETKDSSARYRALQAADADIQVGMAWDLSSSGYLSQEELGAMREIFSGAIRNALDALFKRIRNGDMAVDQVSIGFELRRNKKNNVFTIKLSDNGIGIQEDVFNAWMDDRHISTSEDDGEMLGGGNFDVPENLSAMKGLFETSFVSKRDGKALNFTQSVSGEKSLEKAQRAETGTDFIVSIKRGAGPIVPAPVASVAETLAPETAGKRAETRTETRRISSETRQAMRALVDDFAASKGMTAFLERQRRLISPAESRIEKAFLIEGSSVRKFYEVTRAVLQALGSFVDSIFCFFKYGGRVRTNIWTGEHFMRLEPEAAIYTGQNTLSENKPGFVTVDTEENYYFQIFETVKERFGITALSREVMEAIGIKLPDIYGPNNDTLMIDNGNNRIAAARMLGLPLDVKINIDREFKPRGEKLLTLYPGDVDWKGFLKDIRTRAETRSELREMTSEELGALYDEIMNGYVLYHGTSSIDLESIRNNGLDDLKKPFDPKEMDFYEEIYLKAMGKEVQLPGRHRSGIFYLTTNLQNAEFYANRGSEIIRLMLNDVDEVIRSEKLAAGEKARLASMKEKYSHYLDERKNNPVVLRVKGVVLERSDWELKNKEEFIREGARIQERFLAEEGAPIDPKLLKELLLEGLEITVSYVSPNEILFPESARAETRSSKLQMEEDVRQLGALFEATASMQDLDLKKAVRKVTGFLGMTGLPEAQAKDLRRARAQGLLAAVQLRMEGTKKQPEEIKNRWNAWLDLAQKDAASLGDAGKALALEIGEVQSNLKRSEKREEQTTARAPERAEKRDEIEIMTSAKKYGRIPREIFDEVSGSGARVVAFGDMHRAVTLPDYRALVGEFMQRANRQNIDRPWTHFAIEVHPAMKPAMDRMLKEWSSAQNQELSLGDFLAANPNIVNVLWKLIPNAARGKRDFKGEEDDLVSQIGTVFDMDPVFFDLESYFEMLKTAYQNGLSIEPVDFKRGAGFFKRLWRDYFSAKRIRGILDQNSKNRVLLYVGEEHISKVHSESFFLRLVQFFVGLSMGDVPELCSTLGMYLSRWLGQGKYYAFAYESGNELIASLGGPARNLVLRAVESLDPQTTLPFVVDRLKDPKNTIGRLPYIAGGRTLGEMFDATVVVPDSGLNNRDVFRAETRPTTEAPAVRSESRTEVILLPDIAGTVFRAPSPQMAPKVGDAITKAMDQDQTYKDQYPKELNYPRPGLKEVLVSMIPGEALIVAPRKMTPGWTGITHQTLIEKAGFTSMEMRQKFVRVSLYFDQKGELVDIELIPSTNKELSDVTKPEEIKELAGFLYAAFSRMKDASGKMQYTPEALDRVKISLPSQRVLDLFKTSLGDRPITFSALASVPTKASTLRSESRGDRVESAELSVNAIKKLLKGGVYDRERAIKAIGEQKLYSFAPDLVALLSEPVDVNQIVSVAHVLWELGDQEAVRNALLKNSLWPKGLPETEWRRVLEGFELAKNWDGKALLALGRAGYPALGIYAVFGGLSPYLLKMENYKDFVEYIRSSRAKIFETKAILKACETAYASLSLRRSLVAEVLELRKTPGLIKTVVGWLKSDYFVDGPGDNERQSVMQAALIRILQRSQKEAFKEVLRVRGKYHPSKALGDASCALVPIRDESIKILVDRLGDSSENVRVYATESLLKLSPEKVQRALRKSFVFPAGLTEADWKKVLEAWGIVKSSNVSQMLQSGPVLFPAAVQALLNDEQGKGLTAWLKEMDIKLFKAWLDYCGTLDGKLAALEKTLKLLEGVGKGSVTDGREKVNLLLSSFDQLGSAEKARRIFNSLMERANQKPLAGDFSLMLTNRCPFGCPMCIARAMNKERHSDVPVERLRRTIDQLKGTDHIRLVGPGETTAYGKEHILEPGFSPEFVEIVNRAASAAREVWVVTNGSLIPVDAREAQKLLGQFPRNVVWVLSVDNEHAGQMEKVQKGKKLADVVRTLEGLAQKGIGIRAHYFVAYHRPDEPRQIVSDYGLSLAEIDGRATFFPVVQPNGPAGIGMEDAESRDPEHLKGHSINPGATDLYIDMDGDVTGSNHAAFMLPEDRKTMDPVNIFGNIKDKSLDRILLENYMRNLMQRKKIDNKEMYESLAAFISAACLQDENAAKNAALQLKEMAGYTAWSKHLLELDLESRVRIAIMIRKYLPQWENSMALERHDKIFTGLVDLYLPRDSEPRAEERSERSEIREGWEIVKTGPEVNELFKKAQDIPSGRSDYLQPEDRLVKFMTDLCTVIVVRVGDKVFYAHSDFWDFKDLREKFIEMKAAADLFGEEATVFIGGGTYFQNPEIGPKVQAQRDELIRLLGNEFGLQNVQQLFPSAKDRLLDMVYDPAQEGKIFTRELSPNARPKAEVRSELRVMSINEILVRNNIINRRLLDHDADKGNATKYYVSLALFEGSLRINFHRGKSEPGDPHHEFPNVVGYELGNHKDKETGLFIVYREAGIEKYAHVPLVKREIVKVSADEFLKSWPVVAGKLGLVAPVVTSVSKNIEEAAAIFPEFEKPVMALLREAIKKHGKAFVADIASGAVPQFMRGVIALAEKNGIPSWKIRGLNVDYLEGSLRPEEVSRSVKQFDFRDEKKRIEAGFSPDSQDLVTINHINYTAVDLAGIAVRILRAGGMMFVTFADIDLNPHPVDKDTTWDNSDIIEKVEAVISRVQVADTEYVYKVQRVPRPADYPTSNGGRYASHGVMLVVTKTARSESRLEEIITRSMPQSSEVSFIDLDTGEGNFITAFRTFLQDVLKYRVIKAQGTEPLGSVKDKAPASLQNDITHANAQFPEEFMALGQGTFDIVTVNNIETAPGELARRAKELLKPEGLLLITVEELDADSDVEARIVREIEDAGFEVRVSKIPEDYPKYKTLFKNAKLIVAVPKAQKVRAKKRAESRMGELVNDLRPAEVRSVEEALAGILKDPHAKSTYSPDISLVAGLIKEGWTEEDILEAAEGMGRYPGVREDLEKINTDVNSVLPAVVGMAQKLLSEYKDEDHLFFAARSANLLYDACCLLARSQSRKIGLHLLAGVPGRAEDFGLSRKEAAKLYVGPLFGITPEMIESPIRMVFVDVGFGRSFYNAMVDNLHYAYPGRKAVLEPKMVSTGTNRFMDDWEIYQDSASGGYDYWLKDPKKYFPWIFFKDQWKNLAQAYWQPGGEVALNKFGNNVVTLALENFPKFNGKIPSTPIRKNEEDGTVSFVYRAPSQPFNRILAEIPSANEDIVNPVLALIIQYRLVQAIRKGEKPVDRTETRLGAESPPLGLVDRSNVNAGEVTAKAAKETVNPYGKEEFVNRGMEVLDGAYKLSDELKARVGEQRVLLIGVGRGYAALEMALKFPNVNIVAVNKQFGLWNDDLKGPDAERRFRQYTADEIRAAKIRIDLKFLDIENENERKAALGDQQFDFVVFESRTQIYMRDKVKVMQALFNERLKMKGLYAFVIDTVFTSNQFSLGEWEMNACNVIREAFKRSAEERSEKITDEYQYLTYVKTSDRVDVPLELDEEKTRVAVDGDKKAVPLIYSYYKETRAGKASNVAAEAAKPGGGEKVRNELREKAVQDKNIRKRFRDAIENNAMTESLLIQAMTARDYDIPGWLDEAAQKQIAKVLLDMVKEFKALLFDGTLRITKEEKVGFHLMRDVSQDSEREGQISEIIRDRKAGGTGFDWNRLRRYPSFGKGVWISKFISSRPHDFAVAFEGNLLEGRVSDSLYRMAGSFSAQKRILSLKAARETSHRGDDTLEGYLMSVLFYVFDIDGLDLNDNEMVILDPGSIKTIEVMKDYLAKKQQSLAPAAQTVGGLVKVKASNAAAEAAKRVPEQIASAPDALIFKDELDLSAMPELDAMDPLDYRRHEAQRINSGNKFLYRGVRLRFDELDAIASAGMTPDKSTGLEISMTKKPEIAINYSILPAGGGKGKKMLSTDFVCAVVVIEKAKVKIKDEFQDNRFTDGEVTTAEAIPVEAIHRILVFDKRTRHYEPLDLKTARAEARLSGSGTVIGELVNVSSVQIAAMAAAKGSEVVRKDMEEKGRAEMRRIDAEFDAIAKELLKQLDGLPGVDAIRDFLQKNLPDILKNLPAQFDAEALLSQITMVVVFGISESFAGEGASIDPRMAQTGPAQIRALLQSLSFIKDRAFTLAPDLASWSDASGSRAFMDQFMKVVSERAALINDVAHTGKMDSKDRKVLQANGAIVRPLSSVSRQFESINKQLIVPLIQGAKAARQAPIHEIFYPVNADGTGEVSNPFVNDFVNCLEVVVALHWADITSRFSDRAQLDALLKNPAELAKLRAELIQRLNLFENAGEKMIQLTASGLTISRAGAQVYLEMMAKQSIDSAA